MLGCKIFCGVSWIWNLGQMNLYGCAVERMDVDCSFMFAFNRHFLDQSRDVESRTVIHRKMRISRSFPELSLHPPI